MQSMEEIYQQYSNTVYRYLIYLSNDVELAEDLTQETFAIAVKEIPKFRGDCKVSVWLCQIAKHLWYKELKKRKKRTSVSMEDLKEEIADVEIMEEEICCKEEKLHLYKAMQKLDDKSKEVMYLRLIGNLSFIEIAEVLGKTPNWARVTFFRAKQKIKEGEENGKESGM